MANRSIAPATTHSTASDRPCHNGGDRYGTILTMFRTQERIGSLRMPGLPSGQPHRTEAGCAGQHQVKCSGALCVRSKASPVASDCLSGTRHSDKISFDALAFTTPKSYLFDTAGTE
jgi:hypothetical protein